MLYECLTARNPFEGATVTETVAAILRDEPDWNALPASTPGKVTDLLHECLRKDSKDRLRDMGDARIEIEEAIAGVAAPDAVEHVRIGTKRNRWYAALLVALVAGILGFWLMLPPPPPRVLSSKQLTRDGRGKIGNLVTDGPRVYFVEAGNDTNSIAHVPVTGGVPITIPIPSLYALFGVYSIAINDISLNHDRLLVGAITGPTILSPLWDVPITGSTPHRVSDLALSRGGRAKWSPDGQSLAYTNDSDLFIARNDGTESRKLSATKGLPTDPVWSPNGESVRFTLEDLKGGRRSLWEVSIRKGKPYELLSDFKQDIFNGCWTPDGKYFLFLSNGSGSTDIWAMREHRSFIGLPKKTPIQLTFGPVSYYSIVVSHDGKKVFALGTQPRGEVERYDPKSGRFQPFPPGLSADCCAYSNDGKWIAYVTFPERDLWRSRADGSQRQQLTWHPTIALNPHWSPDGKEIAFAMELPGKTWKCAIVAAEGGIPQPLTQNKQNDCLELDANWSPDGTRITYAPLAADLRNTCPVAVYIMDLKTRAVSTLPGSQGLWAPLWSPDGKRIIALNSNNTALMVYEFKTQKWSKLVGVTGGMGFMKWSADSKLVYYWAGPPVTPYSICIEDGKIEKLASTAGIATTGTTGYWGSHAPDGSPIILRDLTMWEIYALDWEAP